MPYLIDGHNLIPLLGLSLRDPDDEMKLVKRLQEFCRVTRQNVEVYFDGAPAGQVGTRKFGMVTAHFVRAGTTADDAIRQRLDRIGKESKNFIVISNDQAVLRAARVRMAQVVSSSEFLTKLFKAEQDAAQSAPPGRPVMDDDELQEWLDLFGGKN